MIVKKRNLIKLLLLIIWPLLAQENMEDFRRFNLELTFGFSLSKPTQLYQRGKGIEGLITQYSKVESLDSTNSGDFKENTVGYPITVSANYNLNQNWFLKAGLEYTFTGNDSEKNFNLKENNQLIENQVHNLNNSITYFMPFVGGGVNLPPFSIYAWLGLNFTHFTHTHTFDFESGDYNHQIKHIFNTRGIAPGFFLGVQYHFLRLRRFKLLARAEFIYLNVSGLKGEKESITSNSIDNYTKSMVEEGTLFSYEMDAYSLGVVPFWDLFDSSPRSSLIKNSEKMNLNLSCVRITIGFGF